MGDVMIESRYSTFTIYKRLLHVAQSYWLHIIGLFLLSLLSTPLALLVPIPLKIAVDSVVGSEPIPGILESLLPATVSSSNAAILIVAVALLVGIAFLSQLQELGTLLLRTYTGQKLVLEFRSQLFRHVQRLSLSYHDSRGAMDSTYRIQYDAPAIEWIVIDGIIPFITSIFTLGGMIYITLRIDWQLAIVALTVSPILFLSSRALVPHLRSKWHEAYKLQSSALSIVQEVLAAVRVVKAFGQEDREKERFVHRSNEGFLAQLRIVFLKGGFGLFIGLIIAMGTATVLFIGIRHVQSGTLTLGELLIVMTYLALLYGPLSSLSTMVTSLQSSLASAERAFSILDEPADVIERPNAKPIVHALGALTFRKVMFAYNKEHPVLYDISFEIPSDTRVGIIGATGAGKTTLISLLTRFYDPTEGNILLDGIDLRDYKLTDLRNQFALVLQEPVLFSTTISENIAYARLKASEEEIAEAAKLANAHDFISHLPHGYQTQAGERGMTLSGGERQRIALARAFLKNAPILILDEPTSSIDIKTETVIMDAIERLMSDRTTFIITHRLNTLRNCDLLLVIENGQLTTVSSDVSATIEELLISKKHQVMTHTSEKEGRIYDPSG
jgi:ATP-binding cassette subfamily B protein